MDALRSLAPRRIAVFRALYLGDLLCAIPALNALDRRFPDAEITLIGLPWARELADRLPAVDRFVEFVGYPGLPELACDDHRTAEFLESLRRSRFDLAIQMHGSGVVSNGLVAELGAETTIGFAPPGERRLTAMLPWREEEHEIERWLRLVAALGAGATGTQIEVPVFDAERDRVDRLMASVAGDGRLRIGLHCGSKLASRRWPVERFAELGDQLARRFDASTVLTGGAGERKLAGEVTKRMRTQPLDLVGRTTLGDLLAVIDRLDLLVTNDTGASHVAAATRTPSVVLFGPSRPAAWAPLDRSLHTVIDAREFVGTEWAGENLLERLPVEPVLAACIRSLVDALTEAP